MNRGDTIYFQLDFTINEEPLGKDEYDEIELQFNPQGNFSSLKLLMSKGEIEWDEDYGKYIAFLDQDATFKLPRVVEYQLRLKIGTDVVSSNIESFDLGEVLSRRTLW